MIVFGKEFKLRSHSCPACEAKNQTIALLADVVDWHRAQSGPAMQSASQIVTPLPQGLSVVENDEPEYDADEIMAQLRSGMVGDDEATRLLAELQVAK